MLGIRNFLGMPNPYSAIVSALEAAHDFCCRATDEAAELPAGRGGNDIANLVHTARNNLYETLHTAKQWHQSSTNITRRAGMVIGWTSKRPGSRMINYRQL